MATGSVKWFNTEKGFGFIVPDEPDADIFVHISAVKKAGWETLDEGQRLKFELREGRNGRVSADNLEPLDGGAPAATGGAPAAGGGSSDATPLVPMFLVPDVAAAIAYYRHVLGFEENDSLEEDGVVNWAELSYGGAKLWLSLDETGGGEPAFTGMIYILVDSVDQRYDDIAGRAEILFGPEDKPYGLRELAVKDVNGYTLVFAQQLAD